MKLTIDDIGALGDGIAHNDGEVLFVPYTLKGEVVEASGHPPRLALDKVVNASDDRIQPVCSHFGICGGCTLQHWAAEPYLKWKQNKVREAFTAQKLNVSVDPCFASKQESRRRVTFTVLRNDGALVLGFHEPASDSVIDIRQCPILMGEITNHLDDYRHLSTILLRGREEIQLSVTVCENGLDLSFQLPQEPSEDMVANFVRAFARTSFLRAACNGSTLVEREKPRIKFGDAMVPVAPGTFLQAVKATEEKMSELVCHHLKKSKRVADLFCGSGTFSLPIARKSRVHCVETEADALAALDEGARVEGCKPITTEQRDLFEAPLTTKELNLFDGVCLDPPRAGALEQAIELSKSDVKAIAYVSCNPLTLARDAEILVKAGYSIDKVVPLDQFLYSAHVEVVALFSKKPTRKQRPIFGRKV